MNKGFTLLELMIVIVILGVLSSLITGNFLNSLKKGRDAQRKADLGNIQKALEMYYEDNRAYPTSLAFGGQLCYPGQNGCSTKIYMQKLPNDPKPGINYVYKIDPDGGGVYYQLYACLENDQQVLPYVSQNASGVSCSTNCKDPANPNPVPCIFGISSTNTAP
ncbi:prepilin-type N-terminal cleavage/methylation domain-containing protein [Candidatus Roizmanbacteria bacterium]|nr:prepilin-type N-terminal cleavage/methylation domain-containing protein [Candidatus Roizmanbacteria bacterium]